jgi:hypothetical protein
MIGKFVDDGLGELAVLHIAEGRLVDHIERCGAAQPRQKRQPRFARTGAEHREGIGADLRGVAALAGVARAGVVDRDIGAAEAGLQYGGVLGPEGVELDRQQADHLPL